MKSLSHLLLGLGLAACAHAQASPIEPYPDPNRTPVLGYSTGDSIPIECIQRNIETGEHKFDDKGDIVYAPFPNCFETDAPLSLKYNVDEVFNCTIDLGHDFFHVFQLLIHEDVPFSCRIPYAKATEDKSTKPAYIPFTFSIRGNIQESHLHIDPSMNVAVMANSTGNTIIASSAFSAGSLTHRAIIGDMLPLSLAVRWYKGSTIPTAHAALLARSAVLMYCFGTFLGTAAVAAAIFYGFILPKKLRLEMKHHIPGMGGNSYDKLD